MGSEWNGKGVFVGSSFGVSITISPMTTAAGAVVLDSYKGVLRVTVHVKNDYDRAVRIVVNPATDTWKSFLKEARVKLRLTSDEFVLYRASSKAPITAFADLRQNDIITLEMREVVVDDRPLTDSPLSIARTKHMRVEGVGPTNQVGVSFITTCAKRGTDAGAGLRPPVAVAHAPLCALSVAPPPMQDWRTQTPRMRCG